MGNGDGTEHARVDVSVELTPKQRAIGDVLVSACGLDDFRDELISAANPDAAPATVHRTLATCPHFLLMDPLEVNGEIIRLIEQRRAAATAGQA